MFLIWILEELLVIETQSSPGCEIDHNLEEETNSTLTANLQISRTKNVTKNYTFDIQLLVNYLQ